MELWDLSLIGSAGQVLTAPLAARNKPYRLAAADAVVATVEPGPEKRTELVRVLGAVWLLRRERDRSLTITDTESGRVVARTDKRWRDCAVGELPVRLQRGTLSGTPKGWVGADEAPLLSIRLVGVFRRSVESTIGPAGLTGWAAVALAVASRHVFLDAGEAAGAAVTTTTVM